MRRLAIAIAAACTCAAAAGPARADDDHVRRRALARIERAEPTVEDTVAAAVRHAGLGGAAEASLRRRARLAAALPTLQVQARRETRWDEAPGGARVVGEVDKKVVVEARATWRLDRLVFDAAELRIAALGSQRARARAALAAQVTSLYYRRRAAQVDALWRPPQTTEEAVRRDLALEELGAQLDTLTGGWWSTRVR